MKSTVILMCAMPAVCTFAGYGAGTLLANTPDAPAHQSAEAEAGHDAAGGHGTPVPEEGHGAEDAVLEVHATSGDLDPVDTGHHGMAEEVASSVVSLGQMTVPVYKPGTVTYVVLEMGIAMGGSVSAKTQEEGEPFARLRDAALAAVTEATQRPIMTGAEIDTDALSGFIRDDLRQTFAEVEDVLFLSLFKQDVPRT